MKKTERTPRPAPAPPSLDGPARGIHHANIAALALLALLTAIFYWPILSGAGFLWNDFLEQNFPYRLFAAISLRQGEFPFWNPYVFSGMPFFADVQAAVLYPLNLALTLFASQHWLTPLIAQYQIILHILIAAAGMLWLCRDLGCRMAAALCGAITFMFCAFFTTHIFHANLIHAAAYSPLAILFVKRSLQRGGLLWPCLCALTLANAFLAGYPQLMVHLYYTLGALTLVLCVQLLRQGLTLPTVALRGGLFALAAVLSIGMSSIQLLPTQELGDVSARPSLDFSVSCEGSLRPYRFITLIAPRALGEPRTTYWGIGAKDVNPGLHSYWETAIYCGIAPLMLAVLAAIFLHGVMIRFFVALAIVSFLLAMGDSFFLYGLAFKLLPGLDRFRVPARFALLFSVSISVLAGMGMQWLASVKWKEARPRGRIVERGVLITAGAFILIALSAAAGMWRQNVIDFMLTGGRFGHDAIAIARHVDAVIYPGLVSSLWIACACAVAGTVVILLTTRGLVTPRMGCLAGCAVIFGDLAIFGMGFAAGRDDPARVYAATPLVKQLQERGAREYFRVNSRSSNPGTDDLGGRQMLFQKNQGSVHRIFLMEGYNPLRLRRQLVDRKKATLDILNVKYKIDVDHKGSIALASNPGCLPRSRMVYRWEVRDNEEEILSTLHDPHFDYRRSVIVENAPPLAMPQQEPDSIAWSARITRYTLNRIEVEVSTGADGLLVLSEIHYPAWRAQVGATPAALMRANYALRAIPVPRGQHTVVCSWHSPAFETGRRISLVSLAVTVVLLVLALLRSRRRTAAVPQSNSAQVRT